VHSVVHRGHPEPAGVVEADVVEAGRLTSPGFSEALAVRERAVIAYVEDPDAACPRVGDEESPLVGREDEAARGAEAVGDQTHFAGGGRQWLPSAEAAESTP
jgi:hypothetical protein